MLAIAFWYGVIDDLGSRLGIYPVTTAETPVGVGMLWSATSLWLYLYFAICLAIFGGAWMVVAPHPWARWSIFGSAFILFITFFQVQVHVAINGWSGAFYNLLQLALSKPGSITFEQYYGLLSTFAGIALIAVTVNVLTLFFVSHYIFRWRTAMNDYYMTNWSKLRTSRAPRSGSRKIPCGSRRPWRVLGSI